MVKGIFSRFGKLTKLKKIVSDSQIFVLVMTFVRKQIIEHLPCSYIAIIMHLLTI
jgi:hypothetical protein